MEPRHLKYTSIARKIRDGKVRPSLQAFVNLPTAETRKEAYGISCLALELAKRAGEKLPSEQVSSYYNKIKGRNNQNTQKEISHIFHEVAGIIPGQTKTGQQLQKELEIRSNQNMTKIVAETVLETMLPKGTANIITTHPSGWQQFFVAILVVLGLKIAFKKK